MEPRRGQYVVRKDLPPSKPPAPPLPVAKRSGKKKPQDKRKVK